MHKFPVKRIGVACTSYQMVMARAQLESSQENFGELIGMSRQMVSLMERDLRPIHKTTAIAVAFVLQEFKKDLVKPRNGQAVSPDIIRYTDPEQ